jgi:hypothetical protein
MERHPIQVDHKVASPIQRKALQLRPISHSRSKVGSPFRKKARWARPIVMHAGAQREINLPTRNESKHTQAACLLTHPCPDRYLAYYANRRL